MSVARKMYSIKFIILVIVIPKYRKFDKFSVNLWLLAKARLFSALVSRSISCTEVVMRIYYASVMNMYSG